MDSDLPQQSFFQALEDLYSPVTPLTQVCIAPLAYYLIPVVQAALSQHGGALTLCSEYHTVDFPPGTTRQELYPRVNDTRYRVTFPDGWEIRLTEHRNSITRVCTIALPVEDTH